jgi:hypothetical protein
MFEHKILTQEKDRVVVGGRKKQMRSIIISTHCSDRLIYVAQTIHEENKTSTQNIGHWPL